ncbi:hypothetical protein [Modestobacter sp. I12A-02662]|uniref:hypothetical protein n=1 Tax=Modestobacter sp. I12A-02662 TaxID=1730496 RepID=UPI0034DF850C
MWPVSFLDAVVREVRDNGTVRNRPRAWPSGATPTASRKSWHLAGDRRREGLAAGDERTQGPRRRTRPDRGLATASPGCPRRSPPSGRTPSCRPAS